MGFSRYNRQVIGSYICGFPFQLPNIIGLSKTSEICDWKLHLSLPLSTSQHQWAFLDIRDKWLEVTFVASHFNCPTLLDYSRSQRYGFEATFVAPLLTGFHRSQRQATGRYICCFAFQLPNIIGLLYISEICDWKLHVWLPLSTGQQYWPFVDLRDKWLEATFVASPFKCPTLLGCSRSQRYVLYINAWCQM